MPTPAASASTLGGGGGGPISETPQYFSLFWHEIVAVIGEVVGAVVGVVVDAVVG